ncbi:vomeronasal type-2 receptor 1-like [Antennarius striatus]|uniref:vomeronasal type-2 receptor 1-like n=1 Tax=Antennarius striatus TaxID=241820 RepID=UPI0035B40CE3
MDDVTVTRTISVRANQKPWLTVEVHRLLKARNAAFRAEDKLGLRTARANLSRGIRVAKRQFSRRIVTHFSNSRDTRNLSNLFIKFADDTTIVGLINNNNETAYIWCLAMWCKDNNLHLNVEKSKEIVVDFRRTCTQHTPLNIDGAAVERVSSTKFLGVHISEDLDYAHVTSPTRLRSVQRCLPSLVFRLIFRPVLSDVLCVALPVLPCLCCPAFFVLCFPACVVLPVLYYLCCTTCVVIPVLSCLCCPACVVLPLLYWLCYTACCIVCVVLPVVLPVYHQSHRCKLIHGSMSLPVLEKKGDIILGGLFSLHDMVVEPSLSFTTMPPMTQCAKFNFRTFRWMQTMIFAIDEINRNGKLLPNITLGYQIYDSCSTAHQALKAAMALMGSEKDSLVDGEKQSKGTCHGAIPVVIGDGGSTQSLVVARILGVLHVPQVSYFSSCACLSDKTEFPTFLRTMPSDLFQVDALVQLVKYFGWTWVGVCAGDDAYGRGGAQIFVNEVRKFGACVAVHEVIPKNRAQAAISSIVSKISSSGARVILVFAVEQDATAFFDEVLRVGLTGIQWLASEAWSTAAVLSNPKKYHHILQGSMGFAIRRADIPGLQDFLLHLHPLSPNALKDPFFIPFWEEVFQCSLGVQNEGHQHNAQSKPPCTGTEELGTVKNIYSDVSQLRISYNVYKAVYAIAHTLKAMKSCVKGKAPFPLQECPEADRIQPWELLYYIRQVEYITSFGDEIMFDENGDPAAMYDLVSWHLNPNGKIEFVNIGKFDETTATGEKKLHVQEKNIVWNGNQSEVPLSVCSNICPPGTRKAIRPHLPICCHDCVICTAGHISNKTDAIECMQCLPQFWSNAERTACVPKHVEFLSFSDTMGITLMAISLLGSFCTCVVIFIFSYHRTTAIVRANNSDLSFLLLFSLTLCFLCSLTFIGRPSDWSCMLRQTAFAIIFVLCISCILGKTIVVLLAFKPTLPGSIIMKWFGPLQQKAIITLSTLVQAVICMVWLIVAPPSPQELILRGSSNIILLCDKGSPIAFALVLGYIGLLACICLFLAFLARKLPDNFNEAKLITFSMLIFCAVWVAFVPAYISSPGKYSTVTEVFAILSSSYGLLGCIFAPKCYIILLRPEKNTRKRLMSKTTSGKF